MKDKAVFFGWIAGLLLLISVLWILLQSAQAFHLLRAVNNVFMYNDDVRRVSQFIHTKTGKTEALGYWYSMYNSDDKMFIFTAFQDGILIPLGAIVSPNGTVSEILPLSAHAEQIFEKLPKSILQIYSGRIENAARVIFSTSQGNGK